jgi:hypothetical protein
MAATRVSGQAATVTAATISQPASLKPLRMSQRAAVSRSQDQMLTRWLRGAGRGPRSGAASVRAVR